MEKVDINYMDCLRKTYELLKKPGLLLVAADAAGIPNVMTIGIGAIDPFLEKPLFMIWVRPSRHTYRFIEEAGDFTVNAPREGMEEIATFCGTVSGRDHDKFKEKGLTAVPARSTSSPIIAECGIHYECRVVHKVDVAPATLDASIKSSFYPEGDYHRLYFGEIAATYADRDIAGSL